MACTSTVIRSVQIDAHPEHLGRAFCQGQTWTGQYRVCEAADSASMLRLSHETRAFGTGRRPWSLRFRASACVYKGAFGRNLSKCKSSVTGSGRAGNPTGGAGQGAESVACERPCPLGFPHVAAGHNWRKRFKIGGETMIGIWAGMKLCRSALLQPCRVASQQGHPRILRGSADRLSTNGGLA